MSNSKYGKWTKEPFSMPPSFVEQEVDMKPKGIWFDVNDDWPRVAQQYGGTIIAPYCWERRLGLTWYHRWDCASGCVWELDAIEVDAAVEQEMIIKEEIKK